MKDLIETKKVLPDDIEKFKLSCYETKKRNVNNLSYWFPQVKDCGIKVPETIVIPLSFEQFKWLSSDNYQDKDICKMGKFIKDKILLSSIKDKTMFFIKTGTFSNKFDFSTCKVENLDKIGYQFLNIYYAAMCVCDGPSTEIVIREFIKSKQTKKIYNGMPLNTEFRVFYDFDEKKVLGIFNYWDREVMLNSLVRMKAKNDIEIFSRAISAIEESFTIHKDMVINLIENKMRTVSLQGKWSIDIMKVENDFYLIDMATAETSYYYEKLAKNKGGY